MYVRERLRVTLTARLRFDGLGHEVGVLRMAIRWCFLSPAGDGKCVVCDSYVKPHTLVRICDECNYGSYEGRCVICGGIGISDAHYCKECTTQEKDVRGIVCGVD